MLKDKKYLFECRNCGDTYNSQDEGADCPNCDGWGKMIERIGTCPCGAEVEFSRFTNTCDKCGIDYNGSGQELAPREQWGEETGETASDIISVDSDYEEGKDIFDAVDTSIEDIEVSEDEEEPADEPVLEGKVLIQVDDEEPHELSFVLPAVPGADNAEELEEVSVDEDDVKVEAPVAPKDMWDWGGIGNFMPWLSNMFASIPKHTGVEISGIERAIAFLQNLDKSVSRAVRSDLKDELDIVEIEKARDEIQNGIDRLEDRLEKLQKNKRPKKSKASEEDALLIKEAQKIGGVRGIVVTVPLLISRIARVCINGMVSGGHDIEDMFEKQSKAYDLTIREQAELLQLLEDSGYPIRRDRGILPNENIDRTRCDNFDWNGTYYA